MSLFIYISRCKCRILVSHVLIQHDGDGTGARDDDCLPATLFQPDSRGKRTRRETRERGRESVQYVCGSEEPRQKWGRDAEKQTAGESAIF